MSTNVFHFVGGPFDGQLRALADHVVPMPVHSIASGGVAYLSGYYEHGTGGQRGKMLWKPIVQQDPPDGR